MAFHSTLSEYGLFDVQRASTATSLFCWCWLQTRLNASSMMGARSTVASVPCIRPGETHSDSGKSRWPPWLCFAFTLEPHANVVLDRLCFATLSTTVSTCEPRHSPIPNFRLARTALPLCRQRCRHASLGILRFRISCQPEVLGNSVDNGVDMLVLKYSSSERHARLFSYSVLSSALAWPNASMRSTQVPHLPQWSSRPL